MNHSVNFKDPITGVHTNTIEGLWQKVKHSEYIPQFGVKEGHLSSYLGVFMWLGRNEGEDLFLKFMEDASRVYDGNCKAASCGFCME